MALQSGQSAAESYNEGKQVMPGVYLRKSVIINAVDFKKAELRFEKKPDLIGVVCYMDTGFDWQKELIISGFPRRNRDKTAITGFGGAKRVDDLLTRVAGFKGVAVNDEGELNPKAVKALVGKEIYWIEYATGMSNKGYPFYNAYGDFAAATEDPDVLVKQFRADVEFRDPKVRRYNRSLLGSGEATARAAVDTMGGIPHPATAGLEPVRAAAEEF